MKKKLITLGIAILLLFSMAGLTACGNYKRWGITLPKNMTREFSKSNFGGFQGDGWSYRVYKLKDEPTEFLTDFIKSSETEITQTRRVSISANFVVDLKVPDEYRPDWNKEYYWKLIGKNSIKNSINTETAINNQDKHYPKELTLIYYPDTLRLIIIEYFL